MSLNRRQFLCLATCTPAFATLCPRILTAGETNQQLIDAGPVRNFSKEGVYDAFTEQGFFVIHKGGKLFALSALCTHRRSRLKAEPDGSFTCQRHGSTFDSQGHVTEGPAQRDLPFLSTSINEAGHLIVMVRSEP